MGSSSAPSRAASALGLFSTKLQQPVSLLPYHCDPPLRRRRSSSFFFFFTLHTTPRSRFLFGCALFFFSSFVHCYHGFLSPRNLPFAQPGPILSPRQFSLFFSQRSVATAGIIITASAGEVAREETKNMRCPPARFFFHLFFFVFRRKKRTICCCAAFLGLGEPSKPPTTSPGDTNTHKRKPASVFSSCRSSVQVSVFFMVLSFSLSLPCLLVRCFYIYFLRSLPLSVFFFLLIAKHPRGGGLEKVSE